MHKQAYSAAKQAMKESNKLDVKYVKRRQLPQYLPQATILQMKKVSRAPATRKWWGRGGEGGSLLPLYAVFCRGIFFIVMPAGVKFWRSGFLFFLRP